MFSSGYYGSELLDVKAGEIELYFQSGGDFSARARALIEVRTDVVSLTMIDANGIVRQSFGGASGDVGKKFTLAAGGGNTIILGLKGVGERKSVAGALLWSIFIALIVTMGYFVALRFVPTARDGYLLRFRRAIKSVTNGNYNVRMPTERTMLGSPLLVDLSESFNFMVEQVARKLGVELAPTSHAQGPPGLETEVEVTRGVVTLVSRLAPIGGLADISETDYSSFLDQYRRDGSAIIFKYGGVIESVSGDEMVAFFNVPGDVSTPELRAISSAVELVQYVAMMNKTRGIPGTNALACKVGLGLQTALLDAETGLPRDLHGVINPVTQLCDDAEAWRVMITSELYGATQGYLDIREYNVGPNTVYAVLGIEEGAVDLA